MHDSISTLEQLYSAVVADVLDGLGYRHQTLGSDIVALTPARCLIGRVFTARAIAVDEIPAEPYKLEMGAIDSMSEGDVLVVDAGYNRQSAFWGELLSTACMAKGVRGVVMSTCCRDMWALNKMDFPVFGIGRTPADSKGRIDVAEIGRPITIDGVKITNGDLIVGDEDGVVVIPRAVSSEVLKLSLNKVEGENQVRDDLAAGMPVTEAFAKHGIL
ncbi:MAG: dimethylmenaquinone methyltransferase [Opitutae bacterium]|nr:dimethylmenaquinone methyltransferase [Rhodospirillaceae bacterium]MBL61857.1 dimethylmenaquinone methyltransferase [Opitutae bacterium]|tara:strand:+ start:549 stop:1196 length:648 start_codon:yes stop_codon:yes gene_type:complete